MEGWSDQVTTCRRALGFSTFVSAVPRGRNTVQSTNPRVSFTLLQKPTDMAAAPAAAPVLASPASSQGSHSYRVAPAAYVSLDVELDGPNPFLNSMRSIGLALFVEGEGLVDKFYRNLQPREHTSPDPQTMRNFWDHHPQQWRIVNENTVTPQDAMAALSSWLHHHNRTYELKWVAKPACVDWMWFNAYYRTYGPPDQLDVGHHCHCLATMLRTYFLVYPVRNKKPVMVQLSENLPYNHNALDDAVCQGTIYMNLRKIFNQTKYQFYD